MDGPVTRRDARAEPDLFDLIEGEQLPEQRDIALDEACALYVEADGMADDLFKQYQEARRRWHSALDTRRIAGQAIAKHCKDRVLYWKGHTFHLQNGEVVEARLVRVLSR